MSPSFPRFIVDPVQCAHILICHGAKSIFVTCVVFSDFPLNGVQIVIKEKSAQKSRHFKMLEQGVISSYYVYVNRTSKNIQFIIFNMLNFQFLLLERADTNQAPCVLVF